MDLEQISSLIENSNSNDAVFESFKDEVSEISRIPQRYLIPAEGGFVLGEGEKTFGNINVIVTSFSHLEEDLSMMEMEETILRKEEYDKILYDVSKELAKRIGQYVPHDKIQRIFPGLDLSDIDSYDFSRLKIKLFVLSPHDYETVFSNINPNANSDTSLGNAIGANTAVAGFFDNKDIYVDLSEKKTILINERVDKVRSISGNEKNNQLDTKDINDDKKEALKDYLRRVVAHELIHLVDAAYDLPPELNEGITEWYTHQIINRWYNKEGIVNTENVGFVGYPEITSCIAILFNVALENGIDGSVIDKAFISNDKESRKEIYRYLSSRYGVEAAYEIWHWFLGSSPLKYIVDLESKQDSKMGEFLRNYGVSSYRNPLR